MMSLPEESPSLVQLQETTGFQCAICNRSFIKKCAFLSHKRACNKVLKCEKCNKCFKKSYLLKVHQRSCLLEPDTRQNQLSNFCFFCSFESCSKLVLREHYNTAHKAGICEKRCQFKTWDEFIVWKNDFEIKTKAQFVNKMTCNKKNWKTFRYLCNRDGYYHPKGQGFRNSTKINGHCPAKIVATLLNEDSSVKVVYCETHIGHNLEMETLSVTKTEKTVIAQKIALQIPFEQILDDIRDSAVDSQLSICHDPWNIVTSFTLKYEQALQETYASVDAWIKHLQSVSNTVRLYKPQEVMLDEVPQLKSEDFFLILMNDAQVEVFNKFGNDFICIDGIGDLSVNDYQLYTIMVLDDLKQGFPCCFLFSNVGDSIAKEIFFDVIFNITSSSCFKTNISPKTLMSDMSDSCYNAWTESFGPPEQCLFSSWHVDKEWRFNLNRIRNVEKRAVIYKKLNMVMLQKDIETFDITLKKFMKELNNDMETKDFAEYFEKYEDNPTAWAYCFRKNYGIKNKMNFEYMHKVLKYIYYEGEKVREMEKTVFLLMKFVRDNLYNHLSVLCEEDILQKVIDLNKIHLESLSMTDTVIIKTDDSWSVIASRNDYTCKIELNNINCTCSLRCKECNYCIHVFSCNCLDYAMNWTMCRHIHLMCKFMNDNEKNNTSKDVKSESLSCIVEVSEETIDNKEISI